MDGVASLARLLRTLAALAAVAAVVAVTAGDASARQEDETVNLLVEAVLCPTENGPAGGGCEPVAGIDVSVATTDGSDLGGCTTEAGTVQDQEVGYCYVPVPVGEVVVTEDTSGLPAGYAPLANPITVDVRVPSAETQDYVPVALFINVPAEDEEDNGAPAQEEGEDDDTTTALPNNGVGTTRSTNEHASLLATLVGLAAFGCAAVLGRRQGAA